MYDRHSNGIRKENEKWADHQTHGDEQHTTSSREQESPGTGSKQHLKESDGEDYPRPYTPQGVEGKKNVAKYFLEKVVVKICQNFKEKIEVTKKI